MSWWWYTAKHRDTPRTNRRPQKAWLAYKIAYNRAGAEIKRRNTRVKGIAQTVREDCGHFSWSLNSPISWRESMKAIDAQWQNGQHVTVTVQT